MSSLRRAVRDPRPGAYTAVIVSTMWEVLVILHVHGRFDMASAIAPSDSTARMTRPERSDEFDEALSALSNYRKKDPSKVVVRFKAVGNAPIMRQNFFKATASSKFQAVIQFLRKELGWQAGEPLFTYINLSFSPAPDDTMANLFKACGTDGHLIVNYSTTQAWG